MIVRTAVRAAGILILFSGIYICSAFWIPGRMTGGGSVFQGQSSIGSAQLDNAGRVTHGFELHCGTDSNNSSTNNNLEINWVDAAGRHHRFHMDDLLPIAECLYDSNVGSPNPPPAAFNTFIGHGTGRLDGASGATIDFVLTDAGEPGGTNGAPPADTSTYVIMDRDGNTVLSVPATNLTFGNQQAHDI
jgi:hypothetical protein